MTATRDPDRIFRAWLDLMPDEASDRVYDAVLGQIDHTPQVRQPWAAGRWRLPDMPRLFLAGAAVVLAVVVGAIALQPRSTPEVGGSPTPATASPAASTAAAAPSTSASASAAAVPTAIQHRWMGGHTTYVAGEAGSSIQFRGDGVELVQANAMANPKMRSDASGEGPDTIRLTGPSAGCAPADIGTYRWSVSPTGRTLTLVAVADACAARSAALAGTWWLEGCRDANTGCLGELGAGTYSSQYVRPILATGEEWAPKFGAVTYTVPDGWANYTDYPNSLGLTTAEQFAPTTPNDWSPADSIDIRTQAVTTDQATPCSDAPGVRATTPEAFVAYLRTVPGLTVGAATATTVDGRPAIVVDLGVEDAKVRPCDGERIVGYMVSGEGQAVGETGSTRLVITSPSSGSLVVIRIEVADASRFGTFAAVAMPIVQSVHFQ